MPNQKKRDMDLSLVVSAIELGCYTVKDITEETGFIRRKVARALRRLILQGVIEERQGYHHPRDFSQPVSLYVVKGTPSALSLRLHKESSTFPAFARAVAELCSE